MTTRVERPVTREKPSVSLANPRGASMQTVAGRTPGPARSFVVAAVFADFARAVEGGDPDAIRLVDPLTPKTSRRPPRTPDLAGGAA
jgi:hypothetical protein